MGQKGPNLESTQRVRCRPTIDERNETSKLYLIGFLQFYSISFLLCHFFRQTSLLDYPPN